eukprot:1158084-Pelagomonas_calceolata.AAC.9
MASVPCQHLMFGLSVHISLHICLFPAFGIDMEKALTYRRDPHETLLRQVDGESMVKEQSRGFMGCFPEQHLGELLFRNPRPPHNHMQRCLLERPPHNGMQRCLLERPPHNGVQRCLLERPPHNGMQRCSLLIINMTNLLSLHHGPLQNKRKG